MTENLDLDALTALLEAATPGPWQALASEVIDDGGHVAWTAASPEPIVDAALIAALRNAARDLIAAARERDKLDGLVADLVVWRNISAEAERERTVERDAARAEVAVLRKRLSPPGPTVADPTAADRVTEWLDDDTELRIPDTDWGRDLYAALRDVLAEVKNLRFGVVATSRLLDAYVPKEKP